MPVKVEIPTTIKVKCRFCGQTQNAKILDSTCRTHKGEPMLHCPCGAVGCKTFLEESMFGLCAFSWS
jgi:hypothetical protein